MISGAEKEIGKIKWLLLSKGIQEVKNRTNHHVQAFRDNGNQFANPLPGIRNDLQLLFGNQNEFANLVLSE